MSNDLRAWAQKVIDTISPFAEKLKKDFYPLQSPMIENPKVLILGLNPGGGYTYESQKAESSWEFKNGRMTVDRLLKGNPDYAKSGTWKYVSGLKKIPFIKQIILDGDYLLMNYYYLSTPDFKEINVDPRHKEAMIECQSLTLELIDILNPSLILVLGTANGMDRLLPFQSQGTILQSPKQRLLIKGKYKSMPVYAIPHPSRPTINSQEIHAIDTNLREGIENRELTKFQFEKVERRAPFSMEALNAVFSDLPVRFTTVDEVKFDCTIPGIDDKLLIRFVPKGGYWGVRDSEPIQHKHFENLKNPGIYIGAIKEPKILMQQSWLIKKEFRMYKIVKPEDLVAQIADDVRNLIDAIRKEHLLILK